MYSCVCFLCPDFICICGLVFCFLCSTFIIDLYSTSGNIVMKIDWLDDVTFVVLSTDNILRLLCVCLHVCVRAYLCACVCESVCLCMCV